MNCLVLAMRALRGGQNGKYKTVIQEYKYCKEGQIQKDWKAY